MGRVGDRPALYQRRAEPHGRGHPAGRRRDGRPGGSQPAPVAERDTGRRRRAGGVRHHRLDARWPAKKRIKSSHAIRHRHPGPQRPVQTWPPLAVGALRRTSTIDTHPAGTGRSDVDLRARDAVGRERARWTTSTGWASARISPTAPSSISPPIRPTTPRPTCRQPGRPGVPCDGRQAVSDEVRRARLLHLLLDDWVGAALVSGYAVQHAAITLGIEAKLPPGAADHMAGICAGFAADASLVPTPNATAPSRRARPRRTAARHRRHPHRRNASAARHATVPQARPPPDDRARCPLPRLATSTATVSRRSCTNTRSRARSMCRRGRSARSPRSCGCCRGRSAPAPSEVPRASEGMALAELRDRVRGEFVGISTCTHLNDTLRAIADLDALSACGPTPRARPDMITWTPTPRRGKDAPFS